MVLFILGGAVGAMAAWQIHLLSCCFLLSRGEQMSLSCRCSRLHLAGVGAGFAVFGMGGRALADCRTASFIRRTAQSTLFQLKHRTDSRLIISNSLSPSSVRSLNPHMITDSRLDPPLPRQCPIRSVIPKTWRTTLPPALSGFMGFERMPSSFEKGFDVVLIEKFDDVSIFWKRSTRHILSIFLFSTLLFAVVLTSTSFGSELETENETTNLGPPDAALWRAV
jgi:hypothetical protein